MHLKLNKSMYIVSTSSSKQRSLIIDLLLKCGFLWHGEPKWKNGKEIQLFYSWANYPHIQIDTISKKLSGTSYVSSREDNRLPALLLIQQLQKP